MRVELKDIGIPPRPAILDEIDREMARDAPDFSRLARLIGSDVALAAGLIKTTNSPYYGLGKKVRTVQEALLLLGLKSIVRTIAGLSLQGMFKDAPRLERFWDVSAKTACLAGWLAQKLRSEVGLRPEDAYTFGLFRDCGIPLLMIPFPEYEAILKVANADQEKGFTQVEDELLSINHAVVGAELAEGWLLPGEVAQAIQHHHDPVALEAGGLDTRPARMVALGQLAEHILFLGTGRGKTAEWAKLGTACLAVLGIDEAAADALAAEAAAERAWDADC
ncbi:MAG: HDOD domain-containing protein [Azonexus sp.]|nr:HDOD domain-containing protein [Betaproteobacteria bacterium]MBK8918521.1 HDOD domain-containing protein [Betaproteobacteria bacterium]MBP6035499.1 HDOD domain-containing protein [Azonexus sp.]MBP6906377.1 HDOD domain-containing protein [Azonexus sp.]